MLIFEQANVLSSLRAQTRHPSVHSRQAASAPSSPLSFPPAGGGEGAAGAGASEAGDSGASAATASPARIAQAAKKTPMVRARTGMLFRGTYSLFQAEN